MRISLQLSSLIEHLLKVESNVPDNHRRGRLLARIMVIAFACAFLVTLINLWFWLTEGSLEDKIYVFEDVGALVALWGVWLLNRSGRTSSATHFLLGIYIVATLSFIDIHDLNHSFLLFAAPIALASYMVKPWFSFLYAGISMLALVLGNFLAGYPEAEFAYFLNGVGLLILSLVTYFSATYLMQTETRIGESEEKYRSMFDNVPIGLYRTTPDGRILEVNSTFLRMFGYPDFQSIQKVNAIELYADPSSRAGRINSIAEGGTLISELHMRDMDGRTFWVADYVRQVCDANGKVKFYEGSLIDTTSRRMAEEESHESLARLEALVGNIPQGVLFEDELRHIQFVNKTFCGLFGIPSVGSILGEDSTELISSVKSQFLDPERIAQGVGHRLAERKIALAEELPLADGRIFERDHIPLFVVGKYVGSYWLYRDITDRKRAEESLRQSEANLMAAQAIAKLGSWNLDPVSKTGVWSQEMFRLFNRDPSLGAPNFSEFLTMIHPDDRQKLIHQQDKIVDNRRSFDMEVRAIEPDGSLRWFALRTEILPNESGGWVLTGTTQDITERKQAEERIQEQIQRLAALRTIDAVITSSTDLDLSLNAILDQALIQLRVDAADILLLNPVLNTLEYAAGKGFHTRNITQSRLRLGEGSAGTAALTRSLVQIHDLKSAAPAFLRADLLAAEKFACYSAVPLIAKGNVLGVLETFDRSHVERDHYWLDFLESLSAQAAIGIDNASLFENLQRSNMELSMAYETTLEGWSAALDLRDNEAEGHTQRVTDLTYKIAVSMGIRGQELVNIRRGALLHDIGKIGVPDRILFKADALTQEESETMSKHPQFAYDLLHPIVYLRNALEIPYCHHEKWDGTGYPRGLKGTSIPVAARIFAVADIYDAITTDHPNREVWPRPKALEHIRSLSGTHFDPDIVKAFLREVGEE